MGIASLLRVLIAEGESVAFLPPVVVVYSLSLKQ